MNKKSKIRDAVRETNPWWRGVHQFESKPRELYSVLLPYLTTRQIIALTGLRRVGKTTLLLKLAHDYLQHHDPTTVFYFSFDDFRDVQLREVIQEFSQMMGKDLSVGTYFFLFDEIQKLSHWEEQVKRFYDQHQNIKIVISGSESLFIRKKSKESLAGRLFEFRLHPLTFREYLIFKGKTIDHPELYKEDLLREYRQYVLCNGFPEIVSAPNEIVSSYVRTILDKVLYRDIPAIFPVHDPEILDNILQMLISFPGQLLNFAALGHDLGISRQTASAYVDYLEKSFLVKKLYNFSLNARKTQRKMKKYYPTILLPEVVEKTELAGQVFETSLVLQLNADFFWRDPAQHEVDVVLLKDRMPVPIEIKYGNVETRSLRLFMRRFHVPEGIVLTFDTAGEEQGIKMVPFYEYLLKK